MPESPFNERPSSERRRIGLLGGSFNPPHAGHREISLTALERLGLDAVWWLVTPGNPLKDRNIYAPYEERLRLARALSDHHHIVVSDFERRRNLQYTADTIEALQALNPSIDFVWLMGADSLENFHRWKNWRDIAQAVRVAVFNRPGFETAVDECVAAKDLAAFRVASGDISAFFAQDPPAWIYFDDTMNPLSSTNLRRRSTGEHAATGEAKDFYAPYGPLAYFLDLHPDLGDFRADVLEGLARTPKTISPKYFYDEAGSKLFNRITELEEYYPTRTEKSVFLENAADITEAIGEGAAIFEYGSGSSEKVEWLVNGLENPVAYVAMDISREHLIESASALADLLPIPVAAICADFHETIDMPEGVLKTPQRWLGYFPGSTIGNMLPQTAIAFMNRASETLGPHAKFLLGADLVKEKSVLETAYDDAKGVTAAFNLHLLERMRDELGAFIEMDAFEHHAFYNDEQSRIEMHLRATRPTQIAIGGKSFAFEKGESLHTENSHKFTVEKLEEMVKATPWKIEKIWTDPKRWFAACLLSNS